MLDIETLLFPVVLMLGLAFLYGLILRHVTGRVFTEVTFGVTFAVGVVFTMSVPILHIDGVIFDMGGLLVGLSVFFGGWIAGLIAAAVGIVYRLHLGGAGALAGCTGILIAFAVGALWRGVGQRIQMCPVLKDACFGMVSSWTLLSLFLMPFDIAMRLIAQLGPLVFVANVLGAITLGYVLRREVEQLRISKELRQIAEVDPLTNLLNRRGASRARAQLGEEVGRGQALLYFDIDHFKSINDQYGHLAGDAALAAVAGRIRNVVREQVICSRHGGDEFIIFMNDVTEANVMSIANRLRDCVKETSISVNGFDVRVSISVGLHWTEEPESYEHMLMKADSALLEAKATGRDRINLASMPIASQMSNARWANPSKALH